MTVLMPAMARREPPLAKEIAAAMKRTGATPAYADLNAIAPQTVLEIEGIVREAGANFIDGGIIGGPPREGYSPHIGVSGPDVAIMESLRQRALDHLPHGGHPGAMSEGAREQTLARPPPVPVHDDGDVTRQAAIEADFAQQGVG